MAEAVIVNEMLTIQSNDGIQIEVELKLAQCFGKIRSVLDEMQTGQVGTDRITVVLDDVTGDILGKLLVWAEKHKVQKVFFCKTTQARFFLKHF